MLLSICACLVSPYSMLNLPYFGQVYCTFNQALLFYLGKQSILA